MSEHENMTPGDELPRDEEAAGDVPCDHCGGSGEHDGTPCPVCGGTGRNAKAVGGG
jgi:hypothetical protein